MSGHDSDNDSVSSESASMATSTTQSKHAHGDQSTSSDESLARQETRAVNRSKLLVLFAIAIAATGCGVATYFFMRNEEHHAFKQQFRNYAVEVIDLAHLEAENVFGAVGSFADTVSSFAIESGSEWPHVTVPHFEARGDKNNRISKALQVTTVPLVKEIHREEWESYSIQEQAWIDESLAYAEEHDLRELPNHVRSPIARRIWKNQFGISGPQVPSEGSHIDFGPGQYGPVWQQSPAPHDPFIVNYDLLSHPVFARIYHGMWETRQPVLSEVTDLSFLYKGATEDAFDHPHSFLLHPIYSFFTPPGVIHEQDDITGFLVAVLPWDSYFSDLLHEGVTGIVVVLHDTCGDHFTYQINGREAVYIGEGDFHDPAYDHLKVQSEFAPFLAYNLSDTLKHCEYDLRVYPSSGLEAQYSSNKPILYTIVVIMVFLFTATVFMLYDFFVQRRQDKVMVSAKRTNAIVSSLFPSTVRDRLLRNAEEQAALDVKNQKKKFGFSAPKMQLKNFLDEGEDTKLFETKPIADLFPSTTVMFADIVGFTAWSSVREPSQVFTLLETVYHEFDEIAKRRRVFKVETVGDCYVAVAGLPDPRPDHGVVMARFARDCLICMNDITKKLEVSLGPDTGDLSMRIGMHSGPVTAGVLRGDKSRFQLFGDTVNTAARIENTGSRNRIHLSNETAMLLQNAGKTHWIKPREDLISAKGKGDIQTFWLELKQQSGVSTSSGNSSENSDNESNEVAARSDNKWVEAGLRPDPEVAAKKGFDEKVQRLVDWNTDVLARLLKQIVARRNASTNRASLKGDAASLTQAANMANGLTVLDEVKEIIQLPEFDGAAVRAQEDAKAIQLSDSVMTQLRDYVTVVASMYRDNPFHNFEHASHVTMSVVKLLSRIVAPDLAIKGDDEEADHLLHDHTYGITSDPLTQFACVFAALIHDVDHSGVPNAQLVKEGAAIAGVYKGKSVAEQNSVDVAWDLLMDQTFGDLRMIICESGAEMRRFRSLVVNSVMATDIVDKELKALRNARWDRAFSAQTGRTRDNINRKATIVIEHLLQASDVAHTMQHWHIYRKWNERLFMEVYKAYKEGRSTGQDPSDNWYKGELGFFDFYIIPLAKKLADCGVFGVSSDEYLNYAQKNRREWELQGREVVAGMVAKVQAEYESQTLDHVQEEEQPENYRSKMYRSHSEDSSDLTEMADALNRKEDEEKASLANRVAHQLTRNRNGGSPPRYGSN